MSDPAPPPTPPDRRVLSYLAIRQLVGLLGFAVPSALYLFALADRNARMQPSISEFYYTPMGDVLVGGLVAIGVFLLAYRGYEDKPDYLPLGDRATSILAGIGAIGTGVFPTSGLSSRGLCYGTDPLGPCEDVPLESGPLTGLGLLPDGLQNTLHFGSAGVFLLALAYFCLFLFPLGGRNVGLYRACGVLILAMIAAIGVLKLVLPDAQSTDLDDAYHLTFWFETVAVFAFATAWLVKGKPLQHPLGLHAPDA